MGTFNGGGCGHTFEEHEAMKEPGIWETLRFIGYQPGCEGMPDGEMRNVPGTECTLTKPCRLTEAQRQQAIEIANARRIAFKAELDAAMAAVR